jgi:hypothetical protein
MSSMVGIVPSLTEYFLDVWFSVFCLIVVCFCFKWFVMTLCSQLCQNERDPSVKLQAFEYWSALTEAGVGEGKDTRVRKLLQDKFPMFVAGCEGVSLSCCVLIAVLLLPRSLFPLLVRNLRYSEEELADLPKKDVADEMAADSPEGVRPFMFKPKDEEDEPDKGPVRGTTMHLCFVCCGPPLHSHTL